MYYKFVAPLKIQKSLTKFFPLNMNAWRNAHYQVLNNSKERFCREMNRRYVDVPVIEPGKIKTTYCLYIGTARLSDLPNWCSIIQKYFEDWLVDRNIIQADDWTVIVNSEYKFMGIDREDPRCEIFIERAY